jgi:hypothetical protein
MKYDYTSVKNIYIICGKTDMRKGIDALATLIQDSHIFKHRFFPNGVMYVWSIKTTLL